MWVRVWVSGACEGEGEGEGEGVGVGEGEGRAVSGEL